MRPHSSVLLLLLALAGCVGSDVPVASKSAALAACGSTGGSVEAHKEMVDVGGFSLQADIRGAGMPGTPTVVFDSGAGEDHTPWQEAGVQQTIANVALTLSYDRAGMGESEDSGLPHTAVEQAKQLRALLAKTALPPPYLLVSHSIAGFNARVFADLYPDETWGVVFVDSSNEGMNEGTWLPLTLVDVSTSPELSYAEFSETVEQARDTRSRDRLRHKPISVLSATCHGPCPAGVSIADERGWAEFQNDLASLSDDSVHVTAPRGSEHHLMTTQPQMVIDGICEILGRGT